MCLGYHKYTHFFLPTDELGIYHVYRKYTVFCMQKYHYREQKVLPKSHKTLT